MKKTLSFLAALFTFVAAIAQADNTHRVYAELLGAEKGLFSNKVTVTIDFGQNVSFWKKNRDNKIVDENGKEIVFNSMVDAMNYMGERGWVFQQAYVVSSGQQNVYHWLLYKDISYNDDIRDGFNVKADFNRGTSVTYTITLMKSPRTREEWSIENEYRKSFNSSDELNAIIEEWKSKSNDTYIYDVRIKKEK